MREAEASLAEARQRQRQSEDPDSGGEGRGRPLSVLSPVGLPLSPVRPSQGRPGLDGLGRCSSGAGLSDGWCSDLRGSSDLHC